MTPEMKKHLEAVVVAIANEQTSDAKSEFSKYLRLKTQSILLGEEEHEDKEDDKSEDKKDEKKDDDKSDDKKDEKKEDKKEEKKDEKKDKEENEENC